MEIWTPSWSRQRRTADRHFLCFLRDGSRLRVFLLGPVAPALLPWVSPPRSICHVPSLSPSASRFFQRWRDRAAPRDVAAQFSRSLRTVQRLFARFERRGDS